MWVTPIIKQEGKQRALTPAINVSMLAPRPSNPRILFNTVDMSSTACPGHLTHTRETFCPALPQSSLASHPLITI